MKCQKWLSHFLVKSHYFFGLWLANPKAPWVFWAILKTSKSYFVFWAILRLEPFSAISECHFHYILPQKLQSTWTLPFMVIFSVYWTSIHSVEISWFFYHTDFTWNQFWPFQCQFGELQPSKSAKMNKNQISDSPNVLKWQILPFWNPQNWFHVKSVW